MRWPGAVGGGGGWGGLSGWIVVVVWCGVGVGGRVLRSGWFLRIGGGACPGRLVAGWRGGAGPGGFRVSPDEFRSFLAGFGFV